MVIPLKQYSLGVCVGGFGFFVLFCFFKPSNTNELKGLFPSPHTCKHTRKVHAKPKEKRKKREIQSVQTIMV